MINRRRINWIVGLLLVGLIFGFFANAILFPQNKAQSIADETPASLLRTSTNHASVVAATVELASQYHYRNKTLTNEFSSEILKQYLEALDPQRAYFLASDIRDFETNRFYYDNFLKKGELEEVFEIFRVYQQRVEERANFAITLLEHPFDYGLNEQLEMNRADSPWLVTKAEQDALWKTLVKDDILTLKLNEETDEQITETLASRYERFRNSIVMSNAFDVIEIYLNAYLKELDPHSEFFSPHSTSNLKISISQQIEGIGAMLRTESKYTVVQGIITGGPAHLSKRLHIGDRIIAVGNDDDDEYQDIVGWRIEDVVDLIRGPRGTTVNLRILRKDAVPGAPVETVSLVRQTVKLEEQMAKNSTVEIETEGQILQLGVIQLPAFYSNFLDSDDSEVMNSSSSGDVKRLLLEFKEQDIDGIIIDLRGNGGGALHEAVELTGMFIATGPVVQVENSESDIEVYRDEDGGQVVYSGPLVVLVDRSSASASEIFASAIQDYGRGIIVGETTFGKGTLQNIWPLSQLAKDRGTDLGALKLSTAQFFRVNGTTTQHLGVIPDVLFPTNEFVADSGERALDNALPGSVIAAARNAVPWHQKAAIENRIPELRQLNRARTQLNPLMQLLVERDRLAFHRSTPDYVSLNQVERESSLDEDQQQQLDYINEVRSLFGLELTDSVSDDAFPTERIGDVFLDEAVNILADLIALESSTSGS